MKHKKVDNQVRIARAFRTTSIFLSLTAAVIPWSATASAQEMQGVYLLQKGNLAMLTARYVPQLLFKNGEVYTDLAVPPTDLDIAASKQSEPERWGRWRQDGDDFYFTLAGGEEKRAKLFKRPMVPASDDQRLAGVWSYQSATDPSGMGGIVVVEQDIGFASDGTFATGKFAGTSTPGLAGDGTATGYRRQGLTPMGTYRLSGYAAEFAGQDGGTERTLFFFHPEKDGTADPEYINLGTTTYILEEGTANLDLQSQAPAVGDQQAAAPSAQENDGIPITPGLWRVEAFSPDGDLADSDDYCLTNTVFDPMDVLEEGTFDHCEAGRPEIDGQHGIYNIACVSGDSPPIGLKFDLTIEGGEGHGKVALAHQRDGGFVMGEPHSLKMQRGGDC